MKTNNAIKCFAVFLVVAALSGCMHASTSPVRRQYEENARVAAENKTKKSKEEQITREREELLKKKAEKFFVLNDFATPFFAYLDQGMKPLDAYKKTTGNINRLDLDDKLEDVRKKLRYNKFCNSTWELQEISDPLVLRAAIKSACNDIGSLCDSQAASEISEKLNKYYEKKDKKVTFFTKAFATPFLVDLEQGMEPFVAYIKSYENMVNETQLITTNKAAPSELIEKWQKQKEEFQALNSVAQRSEMAAFIRDSSSDFDPDIASKIKGIVASYYYNVEEKIFLKRTGGRSSWGIELTGLLFSEERKLPTSDAVYPYENNFCYKLKVLQSMKNGVLVRGDDLSKSNFCDQILFIKTKGQYADGDYLTKGYFIYSGILKYNTILGVGSKVHSFEEIENPKKDLFFY